jgi:hypothetical protein
MRLFHTTTRAGCVRIADRGFERSRAGKYGPGVYLSRGYVLRTQQTALVLDPDLGDVGLNSDAVVLAFEVPEAVANETGHGGTVPYPAGHRSTTRNSITTTVGLTNHQTSGF